MALSAEFWDWELTLLEYCCERGEELPKSYEIRDSDEAKIERLSLDTFVHLLEAFRTDPN